MLSTTYGFQFSRSLRARGHGLHRHWLFLPRHGIAPRGQSCGSNSIPTNNTALRLARFLFCHVRQAGTDSQALELVSRWDDYDDIGDIGTTRKKSSVWNQELLSLSRQFWMSLEEMILGNHAVCYLLLPQVKGSTKTLDTHRAVGLLAARQKRSSAEQRLLPMHQRDGPRFASFSQRPADHDSLITFRTKYDSKHGRSARLWQCQGCFRLECM